MSRWGRASNSRSACSIASRNRTASSPYNVGIAFIAIAIVKFVIYNTCRVRLHLFSTAKIIPFQQITKLMPIFNSLFNIIYPFSAIFVRTTNILLKILLFTLLTYARIERYGREDTYSGIHRQCFWINGNTPASREKTRAHWRIFSLLYLIFLGTNKS